MTAFGAYHLTQISAGGNLVHKKKTIKFDVLGEQAATKNIKIS